MDLYTLAVIMDTFLMVMVGISIVTRSSNAMIIGGGLGLIIGVFILFAS